MDLADAGQRFLNREPTPGVLFEHNDAVLIVAGESAGKVGSLVTIAAMEPETIYVVELASGFDVEIPQSQLKRADT